MELLVGALLKKGEVCLYGINNTCWKIALKGLCHFPDNSSAPWATVLPAWSSALIDSLPAHRLTGTLQLDVTFTLVDLGIQYEDSRKIKPATLVGKMKKRVENFPEPVVVLFRWEIDEEEEAEIEEQAIPGIEEMVVKLIEKWHSGQLEDKGFRIPPRQQANWLVNHSIDLHIEKLVENAHRLSAYEMLELQLQALLDALSAAIAEGLPCIKIIHGVGSGRLKQEIHRILEEMEEVAKYTNEWDVQHGYGGITVVYFK